MWSSHTQTALFWETYECFEILFHGCCEYSRSLMPKQVAHSSRAMYLSPSASHCSKKRVVQCSMGIRGARRGASSVCVRYLQVHKQQRWIWVLVVVKGPVPSICSFCTVASIMFCGVIIVPYVPVDGVLVELAKLPVDGEDVHVVVLFKVMCEQIQGVIASLKPLLILIDLLHLKGWMDTFTLLLCGKQQICQNEEHKSFFPINDLCVKSKRWVQSRIKAGLANFSAAFQTHKYFLSLKL